MKGHRNQESVTFQQLSFNFYLLGNERADKLTKQQQLNKMSEQNPLIFKKYPRGEI
jgi:hypothetical protein